MIALQNVSKQYKGITYNNDHGVWLWIKNIARLTGNKAAALLAVNNVSFTVNRGEVFGIYGTNGAGKTTLIKMLSGLLIPTDGTIEVDGGSGTRNLKNKVSYISTNGWMGLEWQLTARENLILYGNMFGMSGKTLAVKCDDILQMVGMTEAQSKYISQLSAGMRQKITIARGLVLDRPIIFYDEPSVSLDVQSARNLRELIRNDAAQNNRTAIIASHSAEDLAICERIMLLSKGKVIALGTSEELKKPLSGVQIIELKFPNDGRETRFDMLPGVTSVVYSIAEDKRDTQSVKISARESDFSFDKLIDFLIANNIAAHSINPIDISLQEVYEYYVARKEGDSDAV